MKIKKEMIHYAISITSLKGISFLMLPLITSFLSTENYGKLNFLVSLIAILSIFLMFGLSEIIFRFTPSLNKTQRKIFISNSIKISLIVASIFLINIYLFADFYLSLMPIIIEKKDFLILMTNLSFSLVLSVFYAKLRLDEKSFIYMISSIFQGFFQALLTIFLLKKGFDLTGILISGLLSTLILTLYFLIKNYELLLIKENLFKKNHLYYGVIMSISSLCMYSMSGLENWLIIYKFGESKLAFYFVATQFILGISLIFEAYRMWWYPIRFKYFLKSEKLAAKGAIVGCCLISLISTFMIIIIPYIIKITLNLEYHDSINYIPILSLILIIKSYSELLNLGCYLEENAFSVLKINITTAIISVLGMVIGSYLFEIKGILIALLISQFIRLILFYFISQKIKYLKYDKFPLIIIFLLNMLQIYFFEKNLILNTTIFIFSLTFFYYYFFNKENIKEVNYVK